ncbi:MAG: hypothetical protein V1904_08190 [Bacteroidota bacterium]
MKKLYIFGACHIGKAVVKYSLNRYFKIIIIDDRENIFSDGSFEGDN